jgi:hypothetical protein
MTTDRPLSETGGPTTESSAGEAGDAIPSDPEALAEDIERTRERLGETVEALTVKGRIADKTGEVTTKITDKTGQATTKIAGVTSEATTKIAGRTENLRRQVSTQTARAARTVAQRPVPYAVGAGVLLLAGAWLTRAIKRR